MSNDKDEPNKSVRNANMIGAGQKLNFPRDENGKQHNFAQTVQKSQSHTKKPDETHVQHVERTSPKK